MSYSKYETHVEPRFWEIRQWVRDGLSEKEIAKQLNISYRSLRNYKEEHLIFATIFKSTKKRTDAMVEEAVLSNALGHTYTEQQAMKLKEVYYNDQGRRCEKERVEVVTIEKQKPPETMAGKYWLNNRDKEKWADNPHMVEAKKEEIALRKKEAEMKEW